MSYGQLFFDAVGLDYEKEGINPHFICPKCRKRFEPKHKPVSVLPASFDLNEKVTFTCPICGAQITLYIAVHKDEKGLALCIQRSDAEGEDGIPLNWWETVASSTVAT